MSGNVNGFLADMRYARSESIRRGGGVTLCAAMRPRPPPRSALQDSGPGGPASESNPDWVSGWIVFHDLDNDGEKAPAETLLRVQSPIAALNAIGDDNPCPASSVSYPGCGFAAVATMDAAQTRQAVRAQLPAGGMFMLRHNHSGILSTTDGNLWIIWQEPDSHAAFDPASSDNCPSEVTQVIVVANAMPRCVYVRFKI